ncbi:MAG: hypothetical protein AABX33_09050 [Nanoarchaeota archaeon]
MDKSNLQNNLKSSNNSKMKIKPLYHATLAGLLLGTPAYPADPSHVRSIRQHVIEHGQPYKFGPDRTDYVLVLDRQQLEQIGLSGLASKITLKIPQGRDLREQLLVTVDECQPGLPCEYTFMQDGGAQTVPMDGSIDAAIEGIRGGPSNPVDIRNNKRVQGLYDAVIHAIANSIVRIKKSI